MGSGVDKAQTSSRSGCAAARSSADADEPIAAPTSAKTRGIRKRRLSILLLPSGNITNGRNFCAQGGQFVDLHQWNFTVRNATGRHPHDSDPGRNGKATTSGCDTTHACAETVGCVLKMSGILSCTPEF